ncbi:hypothetical protein FBEOM_5668 [Fusarium beomiforme]|uniref:Uncharacterized protein n=1 Tax=Fusarium beomiforme TaxID=44412 RepID=A0A9P5AKF9_9HYPO|nr:hypothetical protein FBEOM_5668 [Fusarium beomiforme]
MVGEEVSQGVVADEGSDVLDTEDSEVGETEVLVSLNEQVEDVSDDAVEVVQGVEVEPVELFVPLAEVAEDSDDVAEAVQGTEVVEPDDEIEDSEVKVEEAPDDVDIPEVEQEGVVAEDSVVLKVSLLVASVVSLTVSVQIEVLASVVVLEGAVVSCVTVVLIVAELL